MNSSTVNPQNSPRRGPGGQSSDRSVKRPGNSSESSSLGASPDSESSSLRAPSDSDSAERRSEAQGQTSSKLSDVAEQARQTATSLANEANQKTIGFLNRQVSSSADFVSHVADSAKCAADNLEEKSPQLAGLVRDAAERVNGFSHEMRGKTVDELMRDASELTRRQPAMVFGFASLAGFVLFRLLKAKPNIESQSFGEAPRMDEFDAA